MGAQVVKSGEPWASAVLGFVLVAVAIAIRVATVRHVFLCGLPHLGLEPVALTWWQSWGALVVLGVVRGDVGEDNDQDEKLVVVRGFNAATAAAFGWLLVWVIL